MGINLGCDGMCEQVHIVWLQWGSTVCVFYPVVVWYSGGGVLYMNAVRYIYTAVGGSLRRFVMRGYMVCTYLLNCQQVRRRRGVLPKHPLQNPPCKNKRV